MAKKETKAGKKESIAEKDDTSVRKDFIVSTQKACEFFSISRETLSAWAGKGAPKEARGRWDLKKLVEWRFGGQHSESPETRKLKAEADLKETKAQQEKIKLALAEGEFQSVEMMRLEVSRLLTSLKKSLTAIGHNVTTDIVRSVDAATAETVKTAIDSYIREALDELRKGKEIREKKARAKTAAVKKRKSSV